MFKACLHPGCPELIECGKGGYCLIHKHEASKSYNKYVRDPSTQALYNSSKWKATRDRFRSAFPLCQACERQGRVTAGNLVDHVVEYKPGDDFFDLKNLETLCTECHNVKHKSGKA